jgi:hypothetical protein
MHSRCWTADRRFQHGLQDSNTCIICNQEPETMDHILLDCSFTREVWATLIHSLHLQNLVILQDNGAFQWWLSCRKTLPKMLCHSFDSIFFMVVWLIWKERNARTFHAMATSAAQFNIFIQEEIEAWCLVEYRHLRSLLPMP